MFRVAMLLISGAVLLSGCTAGNQKPETLSALERASDAELMDFYKGLHQVGVRVLTENAGEGGRANLQRFNALYFSGHESEAQKHLRMSLFADPFNDDSKAVAAQLESADLFGLLSGDAGEDEVRRINLGAQETLPDLSLRVYGNEYYAVLLKRYNAHFNPDYLATRQVYVPDLNRIAVLENYRQNSPSGRPQASSRAVTASQPVRQQPVSPRVEQPSPDTVAVEESDIQPLVEEVSQEVEVVSEPDTPLQPVRIAQPTPRQLHQRGQSAAAYRALREQPASERDQGLYEQLKESLVEAPYRQGVSHFHAQEVRQAIEKFQRVLSLEPEHPRARQYMERAARLDARLSDIE